MPALYGRRDARRYIGAYLQNRVEVLLSSRRSEFIDIRADENERHLEFQMSAKSVFALTVVNAEPTCHVRTQKPEFLPVFVKVKPSQGKSRWFGGLTGLTVAFLSLAFGRKMPVNTLKYA